MTIKYEELDMSELFDDIKGMLYVKEVMDKYNMIKTESFFAQFGDLSPEKAEDHIELDFKNVEYDYGGNTGKYVDDNIIDVIKDELYFHVGDTEQVALITDDLKIVPLDIFLYTPFKKSEKEAFYDADCLDDAYREGMPSREYCGAVMEIYDDVDRVHEEYEDEIEIDVLGSPDTYSCFTKISKFNENRISDIFQKVSEQGLSD